MHILSDLTKILMQLCILASGHSGNFNKYPIGYIDQLGQPYDYGSIMHYGAYAFAKDRNKMTLEPKQRGVIIGQRVRLRFVTRQASDTNIPCQYTSCCSIKSGITLF